MIIKIASKVFLLTAFCSTLQAQKNKDVQQIGLAAPKNIRIDGKDKEWKGIFMAHHKRTGIYYTMSNDDQNLYLVVKADNAGSVNKILSGGLTLSIDLSGEKRMRGSRSLTYPFFHTPLASKDPGVAVSSVSGAIMTTSAPVRSAPELDAAMVSINRSRLMAAKEAGIRGFKNIIDDVIAIYNDFGIKIFAEIGDDNTFFYEMAIPLKELGLEEKKEEFAYNIMLNGMVLPGPVTEGTGAVAAVSAVGSGGATDFQDLTSPTDFWGKYKLHK